ncbi:hypothetical protein ZIOFF_017690 [Zingiber officinale]|uniref:t-SNARE coiled-coil homology domain-containing protein n=1 Tax=Zingiber officinale TaxID=94328 RepID=A0A8J5HC27_ZINOF|nr:hypothetical protein ZIOFF_017690 [Zingiber officinale]
MNSRRDYRGSRAALFAGIEEGGIRASHYSSHEISEHDNDLAIEGLQDRVSILKRLTGDIHEEVESHNRLLDRMGNDMDSSRGVLSGTVDRFKMVKLESFPDQIWASNSDPRRILCSSLLIHLFPHQVAASVFHWMF